MISMIIKYEVMTITHANMGEDGARSVSNTIKDLISELKGKVLNSDYWGKRKYSYKVKNEREGFYEVIEFELDSDRVDDLKSKLNFMDDLVRYLVTAV